MVKGMKEEKKKIKDIKVTVNQSHYMPEVPRVFQEIKVPRLHNNDQG